MLKRDREVHFVMSPEEIERMRLKWKNLVSAAKAPTFGKWHWTATVST